MSCRLVLIKAIALFFVGSALAAQSLTLTWADNSDN